MDSKTKSSSRKKSKSKSSSKTMKKTSSSIENKKRYNEDFSKILSELETILMRQGEPFKARAYKKGEETILTMNEDINTYKQLEGKPGMGSAILKKLKEFEETGKVGYLERERVNPINVFTQVHGIGIKNAKEIIEKGITTIEELNKHPEMLNNVQKKGLRYYEDLTHRIPREEIEVYDKQIQKVFDTIFVSQKDDVSFEIVGSYRRGLASSGDIDLIITSKLDNKKVFADFLDGLIKEKIIIEVLSRGKVKSLTIGQLEGKKARRLDFLYAPPDEYAFAVLYFTGSKAFNTIMRHHALSKGVTLNEHGLYKMENKKKGDKIVGEFLSEQDIFSYLGLEYKTPEQRKNGNAIVKLTSDSIKKSEQETKTNQKPSVQKVLSTQKDSIKAKSPTKKNSPKTLKQTTPPPAKSSSKKIKTAKKRLNKTPKVTIKKSSPKTIKKVSSNNKGKPKTMTIKRKVVPKREIKLHIKQFLSKNIDYLDKLEESMLVKMMEHANEQYYNEKALMNDNQYDILKEFVEKKFPKNEVLKKIGAPIIKNVKNKVTLPYFMGSMDKIKPTTNAIEKFIEKYPKDYMLSVKLDGVSGLYSTENGEEKLYTRGDGRVGQDISYLIPYLRLPKKENITIRGEFIISKELFAKHYAKSFKNARNFVSGLMNSKSVDADVMNNIDFVAYEVIEPVLKPSDQFKLMETLGVKVVHHVQCDSITNDSLSKNLVAWREGYSYIMDGVIVTHNEIYPRQEKNPEYAFAFKMVLTDQVAEAKIVDVLWSPSKDGYLKPRIRIEPIELGGVTIEYATAFNAAFVVEKKLNLGAMVKIIRSGDVIPYIQEVIEPAEEPKMPDEKYYWNSTHVDIILEDKDQNDEVLEKNITMFFQTLKVKQLSEGTVRKLMKGGYRSICKILEMTKDDFMKIEGIQEKTATNLSTGIKAQLEKAKLPVLMTASNKFEHGFGTKKFEAILEGYPEIIVSQESNEAKIEKLANVKSIAKKSATNFVERIGEFTAFLENCKLTYKLETSAKIEKEYDINHVLFQKHIVMTGFRDEEFINNLKNKYNVKQSASVSKNTFALLVKSHDDGSSKVEKAKSLNISIMTKDEFAKAYL